MKRWTKKEIEFACCSYPKLRTGQIAKAVKVTRPTVLKLFRLMGVEIVKQVAKPKPKAEKKIRHWCAKMRKTFGENPDNWEPEIFKQEIISDDIYAYRWGKMGFEKKLPK